MDIGLVWLIVLVFGVFLLIGWLHYWIERARDREQRQRMRRYLDGLPERRQ